MKLFQFILFLLPWLGIPEQASVSMHLPKPVAYCGPREDYFLGNGVSGAIGTPDGSWNALFGPNYTSPNFIKSEVLTINFNGKSYQIKPEMHRLRETGIYSGVFMIDSISVIIADYSNQNQPWLARLLTIENNSGRDLSFSVTTQIFPKEIEPQIINNEAILLHADTSKWNFSDCWNDSKNWKDRYALISFNIPSLPKIVNSELAQIETGIIEISKNGSFQLALYHHMFYVEDLKNTTAILNSVKNRKASADLTVCIKEWQKWYRNGADFSGKITSQKALDIVEGAQITIKMLQDSSGGILTGLRAYPNGYIRDSHGASRLLRIAQRNEELKKLVLSATEKTIELGYVPNSWPLGYKGFKNQLFHNRNSETPAYYVLMAKYYFENTNDKAFLNQIFPALTIAIDCQLDNLRENNWRIDFNGDETEKYTVRTDGQMYGFITDFKEDEWSLSSSALAIASIDFFVKAAELSGRNINTVLYSDAVKNIKNAIDDAFWRDDLKILDWCRKQDGSFPAYRITNYLLFPAWIGVELNMDREIPTALYCSSYINPETGFLPTAPSDAEGFSGHNLGYYVYTMTKLDQQEEADKAMKTYLNSGIISAWGTVSEFYGPNGTPNGHLHNPFSTGIMGEAIIRYYCGF